MSSENIKVVATNRKARHDYHVHDTYEAGLVLTGSEIKSVRAGQISLREGYVREVGGEMWLFDVHIAHYSHASIRNHEPQRPRKLLLRRREIDRLAADAQAKSYTIVPLRVYLRRGLAKVEIALARGKRQYDKRQAIAKRDAKRQMDRALSDERKRR
jgi:SsrA-binding protein